MCRQEVFAEVCISKLADFDQPCLFPHLVMKHFHFPALNHLWRCRGLPATFHSLPFCCPLWREAFIRFSLRGKCLLHSWLCWSVCVFLCIRTHSGSSGLGAYMDICVHIFNLLFAFLLYYGLAQSLKKVILQSFVFPVILLALILKSANATPLKSVNCVMAMFGLWL